MKNDEFKIGEDFEEKPGTSKLKEDTSFIATIIVVVIAIIIGLIVFFVIMLKHYTLMSLMVQIIIDLIHL